MKRIYISTLLMLFVVTAFAKVKLPNTISDNMMIHLSIRTLTSATSRHLHRKRHTYPPVIPMRKCCCNPTVRHILILQKFQTCHIRFLFLCQRDVLGVGIFQFIIRSGILGDKGRKRKAAINRKQEKDYDVTAKRFFQLLWQ